MTPGVLEIAQSLVYMNLLQFMLRESLNIKDYRKIIAISEDNLSNLKYWKRLSKKILSNITQPYNRYRYLVQLEISKKIINIFFSNIAQP
jgi:hypothetical protein